MLDGLGGGGTETARWANGIGRVLGEGTAGSAVGIHGEPSGAAARVCHARG